MAFIANEGVSPKGERYDRSALVNDTENKLYKRTEFGDFIYSSNNLETGSIGLNKFGNACISPVYSIFKPTGIADSDFIGRRFVRKDFINSMVKWRQGVIYGQWRIHESDFMKIEVAVPEIEEQRKIGAFFDVLDHLITLHQCKCRRWYKIRKFDWEQRKLGELLISLQNNTFSRADLSNETGVAKNVHYGDVLIKFGEVLDVSKEQLPMITDEKVLTKYKASFLQNGDVIVTDTAEDITVGKCSEIAGLNDEVVLSGLHTIPYRPVEKFATGYLGYYLNSCAYHNQLIPLMQGVKVTSISKFAMQDTDIVYPKSMKEQAMIGNYFQSIDHLITLHQWKLEKLKNIKKLCLREYLFRRQEK